MPTTNIRGRQILDGDVSRVDLNTATSSNAVIRKLLPSSDAAITLTSTGVDAGTGDVTLNASKATASQLGVIRVGTGLTVDTDGILSALANQITGSLTTNYIPKATSASTLGNSLIYDNGTNVGIGTTGPSYKLDVIGTLNITSDNQVLRLISANAYGNYITFHNTLSAYGYIGSNYHLTSGGTASDLAIRSEGNLVFDTGGATERMRLTSGGNLLVGTTTDGGQKLQVTGTGNITGALTVGLTSGGNRNTVIDILGNITFKGSSGGWVMGTAFKGSADTLYGGFQAFGGTDSLSYYYIGDSQTSNGIRIYPTTNNALFSGNVGIGASVSSIVSLSINKIITGGVSAFGVYQNGTVQSTVTSVAHGFYNQLNTQAATFTLSLYRHFFADNGTLGAGTTINNQYGFVVADLYQATNNYGFFGGVTAGSSKWNLYMNGTADNYLAGALGIGSTSLTGFNIRINRNLTGAVNYYGIESAGTIQSDVTSSVQYFQTVARTQAATFTLGTLRHFFAFQSTLGAGSTITNQIGYDVSSGLIGATNNYGFRGSIPSGTGRWNIYMDGTANNYLAGRLGIGTTSPNENLEVKGSSAGVLRLSSTSYSYNVFTNDSDGSFYIRDVNNTANRFIISSTGNLGLGVTPSAWSGYTALQNTGGSLIGANGELQLWQNAFYNGTSSIYVATGTATRYAMVSGQHRWFNAVSGTAGNTITWTQAMTLDANGRLGIGTTSPAANLEISQENDGATLRISSRQNNSSHVTTTPFGILEFYSSDASSPGASVRSSVGSYPQDTAGSGGANLIFNNSNSGGLFEAMRITSTGNVGIGTTSPQSLVHASNGNYRISNETGGTFRGYVFGATAADSTEYSYLKWEASGGELRLWNNPAGFGGFFSIYTNASERMRITSGGNVLIGTTTDAGYKLDVNGTGRFSGNVAIGTTLNSWSSGYRALNIGAGFGIMASATNWDGYICSNTYYNGTNWVVSNSASIVPIILEVSNGFKVQIGTTNSIGSVTTLSTILNIASTGAATFSSSVTATSFIKTGGTSSQYLMADGSVTTSSGGVSGSGTTNYIPKWNGTTSLANSQIFDNGTQVTVGSNVAMYKFAVNPVSTSYFGIGFTGTNSIFVNAVDSGFNSVPIVNNALSHTWLIGFGDAMVLNNSGNLLIGTTAGISGGGKLQVNGDVNINGNFKINGTVIGGGGGSGITGSGTTNMIAKWTGGTSLGDSALYDNGAYSIGIGTTNIAFPTDRRGLVIRPNGANSGEILLQNSGNTNGSTDGFAIANINGDGVALYNRINAHIRFGTNNVERLRITEDGNLGFGTTSQFGGGVKVVGLANCTTVPGTTPTGGGILFVQNGALKYMGSNGTYTTIANA
jgi:hypothetical protein